MNFKQAFQIGFLNKVIEPKVIIIASADDLRISIPSFKQMQALPWTSIVRIVAFKRDLFSRDLLCMAIEFESQVLLEINEEMNGWSNLLTAIPHRLPSALTVADWFVQITQYAFKTSPIEIFHRNELPH